MAEIRIQDGDIIVQLGSLEKIGALHGDVRVPRSAVIAMRVVENPFAEIQGIRFPGTGVPGLIVLGTWRRGKARDFVCSRRQRGGDCPGSRDSGGDCNAGQSRQWPVSPLADATARLHLPRV